VRYEAEFEALLRPSASDYDELLRRGSITVRPDNPDEWRADIRARAHADKLRVRTGTTNSDPSVVWAHLARLGERIESAQEQELGRTQIRVSFEAVGIAQKLGHEPIVLRAEKGQAAVACRNCYACAYLDCRCEPPIIDGPLVEDECEHAA
jgi:hypothetical protein